MEPAPVNFIVNTVKASGGFFAALHLTNVEPGHVAGVFPTEKTGESVLIFRGVTPPQPNAVMAYSHLHERIQREVRLLEKNTNLRPKQVNRLEILRAYLNCQAVKIPPHQ